MGKSNKN